MKKENSEITSELKDATAVPKPFAKIIHRVHHRIPLTPKMVLITVALGLLMWIAFDFIQTSKLQNIFQLRLTERLSKQALEDRQRFDRYVKAHLHSAKLFISQRNFSEYIELQKWSGDDVVEVKMSRRSPPWFQGASVLRTFVEPRFTMLLDKDGRVRESYGRLSQREMPIQLSVPSQLLLLKSYGQNFMTRIDGIPYLIVSDRYMGSDGEIKAMLMLASPIDDVFLTSAMGFSDTGHIVALLTHEKDQTILMSSDLTEMPKGMPLEKLREHYLVTGQEFLDYGASEQAIKFVSFISLEEVSALTESITKSERQLRILGLPVLILSFALLMYWITNRIQLLTRKITDFSERALGVKPRDIQKGDQLYILEDSFQRLTEEVLAARDVIKREAEERLLLEKKTMEIRQKVKQLGLLQAVTQAVGVGVIRVTTSKLESVNQQMEQFAEVCGGISHFNIKGSGDLECRLTDIHGLRRIFLISSPDLFEGENILLVQDVTKVREQTAALEYLALHDTLTGLPNRALLQDRLQIGVFVCKREEKALSLLMMDLNRFKEINDTLGHHIGDLVLKEVGIRLPKLLRKSDTIARLGGDEFAVVLPATDIEHAGQTAEKILSSLEEPFVIEGHNLHVGASIGIVMYPEHGDDANMLLQRADVAMYVAKHEQRGVSVYHPDHDRNSVQHLELMGDLRLAIENEELTLCYQPKVSCKGGNVCGIEVLTRWHHPQHGFVPPDEFIMLAEANGLVQPLTKWVLNSSLRQYSSWHKDGLDTDIVMSVNLSARSLQDPLFPGLVRELLRVWNISPELLEFEITESAVMSDPVHALKVLGELDNIGVRLSIDDFGTGYSSLAYMKKLPVDEIKIDKSFVMQMVEDENDAMIVRSTIDLAHNMGLSVIAEGVENQDVLNILEKLGCDRAQGYFICRPVPADEFIKWLHESDWGAGIPDKLIMTDDVVPESGHNEDIPITS